jgi:cytochrome b pre-mRNA-processing protein 3
MPLLPRAGRPLWRKEKASQTLYDAIVAQARLPVFYQDYGVPDTLEGRFAVLSLNLFAVLHRLKAGGGEALVLSQQLADRFKDDMETVLRELGVSDLRVPKAMRALAASSAALLKGYERAFAAGEAQLARAIAAALPLDLEAAGAAGTRLAHYVSECIRSLEAEPYSSIRAGVLSFPHLSASR